MSIILYIGDSDVNKKYFIYVNSVHYYDIGNGENESVPT